MTEPPSPASKGAGRLDVPTVLSVTWALMWGTEIIHLALPNPVTRVALMVGLVLIVIVAWVRARWQTRLLSGTLFAAIAALATQYGIWHVVPAGLEISFIFIAFFSTLTLLHATAGQRSEIATARRLFTALPKDRRGGGVLGHTRCIT